MLEYLVTSRARRELLKLLWGEGARANVSALARRTSVSFSTVYRELQAMLSLGLVVAERDANEVVFCRNDGSHHAALIRTLIEAPKMSGDADHDDDVRGWLHALGAPLPTPVPTATTPPWPEVVAAALVLAHRDATVTRVLPFVLWKNWRAEDD